MLFIISLLYPISIFFVIKYFGSTNLIVLKALPLLISIYMTFLIILSYCKDNAFILKFAKRFSKKELEETEIEYIKHSTLFWIGVCFINIALHVSFLLSANEYYWLSYTSFGWYFVFGIAGVFQFVHRKFIFLKRLNHD